MLLRKTGVAFVLAILVALVAHGAVFGAQHAAGGVYAGVFGETLSAAVLLLVAVTFLRAALAPQATLAAASPDYGLPLALGPGGFFAYTLIEVSEGRSPLAAGSAIFFGCALGALLVGLGARFVAGLAREAASVFVALARYVRRDPNRRYATRRFVKLAWAPVAIPGRTLGRAPPTAR
jgi:hypothetical protein